MDEIGFIKLHRQLLNWEWYDDINVYRLFTHLLLKVNYEPKKWHGITIEAGQIATSYEKLAIQTCLTVKQIRVALDKLKKTGEVASQSTNNYTIITIANWSKWQEEGKPEDKQRANEGQTEDKQRATTKEGKKERNKEESIIGELQKTENSPEQKNIKLESEKRGTRLPADWELEEEDGNWAMSEFGLEFGEVCIQADKFRDYWIAKAGAGGVKRDWVATWRNWIRTYVEGRRK